MKGDIISFLTLVLYTWTCNPFVALQIPNLCFISIQVLVNLSGVADATATKILWRRWSMPGIFSEYTTYFLHKRNGIFFQWPNSTLCFLLCISTDSHSAERSMQRHSYTLKIKQMCHPYYHQAKVQLKIIFNSDKEFSITLSFHTYRIFITSEFFFEHPK